MTIRLGWASLAAVCTVVCLAAPALAQNTFGNPPPPQQQGFPQPPPLPPQQPAYPQQPVYPPQPPPLPPQQQGGNLDQLMQTERQDFGVPATAQLHNGAMHGPTPASIPGGQLITTKGLVELINGRQMPVLILDVLGGAEILPNAQYAVPAHQAGSFTDQTQQQFGQYLQQATNGNKEYPLVLYCLSPQCWMSYNAALRAINLGYKNVLWYRGGIESWKMAGQPVQAAQQQQQQPPPVGSQQPGVQ